MINHSDELSLLRNNEYVINDLIHIKQPTLDDIYRFGENDYFSLVSQLSATPSDYKSMLHDMGIDYETLADFDFFVMMTQGMTKDRTCILFGDEIDFSKMQLCKNMVNDEPFLSEIIGDVPKPDSPRIDRFIYEMIATRIRSMHGFKKNVEKAYNSFTKRLLIQEDRAKQKKKKSDNHSSVLKPLIISMVNCAEFPYNFETVWALPISIFLESVNQVQRYKSAGAILQGIYSGNIDSQKIDNDKIRWI